MSLGALRGALRLKAFLNEKHNLVVRCPTSRRYSFGSRAPQSPRSSTLRPWAHGIWIPLGLRIQPFSSGSSSRAEDETFRSKWPIKLIISLAKDASIDPRQLEKILFDIEKSGHLRKDCDILPRGLVSLADSILKTQNPNYHSTVQIIWQIASRLGHSLATLCLMTQAYRKRELQAKYLADDRKRIQMLAERGNPAALFLHGVVWEEMHGDARRALSLYERSTGANWGNWPDAQKVDLYGGDIWSRISAAKAKLGDRGGAQEALRVSAEDYNDPTAYFHLAKSFIGPYGTKYELFMLKAASSGNTGAAHLLGVYYYEQARGNVLPHVNSQGDRRPQPGYKPSSSTVSTARELAQQWFAVGAEAGTISSMIHNAVLVRGRYFATHGEGWLDRARAADVNQEWARTIEKLATQRIYPDLDFREHSIEAMHRQLDGLASPGGKK